MATPAICAAGPIQVFAAGDIADCREHSAPQSDAAKTAALIAAGLKQAPESRVLTLGDNSYPVGAASEFANCYGPTWGQFKDITLPSPGNHEYMTADAAAYYQYFGDRAGPAQRGYYRSQIGQWRIFSLNSNLRTPEQIAAQLAWLKKELAETPGSCTLAYWHHPVFSSGGHGNNEKMLAVWKVLQSAGVDIVLSGHDHNYERFAVQNADGKADAMGIREFVVGTGGTHLTPVLLRRPNSETINNETPGVLQLTLHEHRYEWAFLAVNGDSFSDKGSANCHTSGKP